MRIACLQFAPQVGDINNNLNRADAVLSRANPQDLDLLVLPELAFSGYNFHSLQHISPYLEPTTAGITSLWARTTALKYNCVVTAGYPEKVDVSPKWPTSPEYYNSAITVNPDGETIANYRKSFLYYTDETWALEGPDGFYDGPIEGLGNVAMGICMDLNPYKFEAPWNAWEFAYHVLHREANLVILSMAWLTREDPRAYSRAPKAPDMETLSYWLSRLEPLIRNEGEEEIICVFANRCGSEGSVTYAGTSAVLGIQGGEVKVYGILGRGDRDLLVVDTSKRPQMQLVSEPRPRARPQPQALDTILAGSSTSSVFGSGSEKSAASEASISTGKTSAEPPVMIVPPLENICFTPTSPMDDPFIRQFFGDGLIYEGPLKESKPLHSDQPNQTRQPTPVPTPTPAPVPVSPRFSRPQSPKSRNCSRSRGPTLGESPLLGNILTEDIRQPSEEVMKTLEHVRQSLADVRSSRADFTTHTRPKPSVSVSPTSHATGADTPVPAQFESSFTRNELGPRSRHILRRPKSVEW